MDKVLNEKDGDILRVHNKFDDLLMPFACKNSQAFREFNGKHDGQIIRTQFSIDIDRIY